jgi:hypothetical protein
MREAVVQPPLPPPPPPMQTKLTCIQLLGKTMPAIFYHQIITRPNAPSSVIVLLCDSSHFLFLFIQPLEGAMLVHPRPMCPRPKILGCCIPWTKCPLANLPLTEPSHSFDLIERSDTRLSTAARFSAAKRWSSMCGPSMHPTEGRQSNKPGQGRRRSRPDAPMIH